MIDRNSPTWLDVVTWSEKRLAVASARIESLGVTPSETENLRGQIAELRALLALTDHIEPKLVEPGEDYGFQRV